MRNARRINNTRRITAGDASTKRLNVTPQQCASKRSFHDDECAVSMLEQQICQRLIAIDCVPKMFPEYPRHANPNNIVRHILNSNLLSPSLTPVCLQLSRGIFALVTPVSGVSFHTLISYSNTFHLPFLYAGSPLSKPAAGTVKRKTTAPVKPAASTPSPHSSKAMTQMTADLIADYGLYLQPDIIHAIYRTMRYLEWDHFVYLYDNDEGNQSILVENCRLNQN